MYFSTVFGQFQFFHEGKFAIMWHFNSCIKIISFSFYSSRKLNKNINCKQKYFIWDFKQTTVSIWGIILLKNHLNRFCREQLLSKLVTHKEFSFLHYSLLKQNSWNFIWKKKKVCIHHKMHSQIASTGTVTVNSFFHRKETYHINLSIK